jgi:hypothetical protein
MSDNYSQPTDDDEDERQTPAELREAAKRGAKAKAEADALKRENAFLRAGIDPDDTRLRYFVKGYEGDLDPTVIRAAAVEAGFIQPPQQPSDPAADQAREGQTRVQAASSGTSPEFDTNSVDYAMEQAYREGGLEGLSAVAQQYGVTFNPEPI